MRAEAGAGRARRHPVVAVAKAWAAAVLVLGLQWSAAPVVSGVALASDAPPSSVQECATTPARPEKAPVLAHFYIWFNASSWSRGKVDYPSVGRYSSDQASVMREQVRQAKAAGIDGFIVSWKGTDLLDSRLETLHDIAAEEHFRLAITYQAQDFNRDPLPTTQIRDDLADFADRYADDPVFRVLGRRPLVAFSGTWHYTPEDLRSIIE